MAASEDVIIYYCTQENPCTVERVGPGEVWVHENADEIDDDEFSCPICGISFHSYNTNHLSTAP